MKKIIDSIQIVILALSSMTTSITIILIIIFLFTYGISLFNNSSIEQGYVLVCHKDNPIKSIPADLSQKIFDQEIINWNEIGGKDDSINLLHIDDLSNFYSEEELGSEFEKLSICVSDYLSKYPNTISMIPITNIDSNFTGKIIEVPKLTLKEVFLGKKWFPTAQPIALFGILPMILGTILVSIGAIFLALPLGISCAIYMSEIMHPRWRKFMKPLIELMAGIPSVVFGFFGLVVIVPLIQKGFNLDVGESALAGSIILGIMALPTIITITEDALRNVPNSIREASLSLGASQWQTIINVVIPYARIGVITAIVLGIGRAIGETMAVLMVTGNSAIIPNSFLQPVRTIPATIAAELGEAPYGGLHFKALFTLASILFIITLLINVYVSRMSKPKLTS